MKKIWSIFIIPLALFIILKSFWLVVDNLKHCDLFLGFELQKQVNQSLFIDKTCTMFKNLYFIKLLHSSLSTKSVFYNTTSFVVTCFFMSETNPTWKVKLFLTFSILFEKLQWTFTLKVTYNCDTSNVRWDPDTVRNSLSLFHSNKTSLFFQWLYSN